MTDFVLVHGSWGGGWQWREVARLLREAGHGVTAPTLSGLGERAHAAADGITLLTHIEDVVQHLWFEDLRDVLLVGWSYGGVVVDGTADRVPDRIRRVVNLDGLVAEEDQSAARRLRPTKGALETGWMPPPSADDLADALEDPTLRTFVAERERPQPVGANTVPFPNLGSRRWEVPHTYLLCTELPAGEEWEPEDLRMIERVRADERWELKEVAINHLGLLYAPEVVADALLEIGD
jgi:pimeloyl-ACP methyl ester carboxylesterase